MIQKIVQKLDNKKIAILGFGAEGISTYQFIRKYRKEMPLFILDKNADLHNNSDLQQDAFVTLITGNTYLEHLEDYDLIIKSPGISLKDINIEKLKDKITSQMQLFLEVARDYSIGITGTKGKSTTSSLIYEIIKKQNPNTYLVGNIGTPVLSILESCNENMLFVIEMSSHQLEFLTVSPHIGIVLNLFEDHLDHAGSVKHYHETKMNMFKNQNSKDIMIYCKDNEALNHLVEKSHFKSKSYSVSLQANRNADVYKKDHWIYFHEKPLYNIDTKRNLLGNHNLENIIVSLLTSELLNLELKKTLETVQEFQPLDYRLQSVGIIDDVEYYMDTLATIPEATIEAIETLKNVNTLIFGGMDRGISYEKFIDYLNECNIEHFICMSATGKKIAMSLPKEKVYIVNTLEEAVDLAKEITKKNTICLLSPAASSYDQFKSYKEKGDKFKEYLYK